ncbi:hypothetical protein GCM10010293_53540 [Streptomyces griseoflavus]|uniref:restriction endonuclease subunit S n=1 Tax=Streptomyces griseoflavus TaxID=35619 RepID=UPI00167DA2FA|nr:restriction endonuclease subunit S [Streptomyces griseoflavus]GGV45481.1 hypothetical protein GCM10010293_53540 [Streptomyces griseoflavus]
MSEWRHFPAGKIARQRREIVRLEPGIEYRTMGVRWYGKGAYDRGAVTTETVKAKSLYRAREGDFTFNRIDTQKGAFDVVSAELDGALATNEFPLYEVNEEEVDARFLLLNFQRSEVLRQIGAMRAGSEGRARWKEADFEAWTVPVPPLPVQGRIIEVIGAVDDQITALDTEAEAAIALRVGLLAESLTISESKEWEEVRLSEVSSPLAGPAFKSSVFASTPVGPRLLRGINLGRFGTRWNDADTVFWPEDESGAFQKYVLEPGDVCIAMDRPFTRDRVLRCGLIQKADLPALLVQRVTRLRANLNRVMPEFLILVVQSSSMAERLAGRQTPGGYAPHISGRDISEFTFALPPLSVQERIVEVIGAVDAKITATRAEADGLRSVRASLLSGLLDRTIDLESAEQGV